MTAASSHVNHRRPEAGRLHRPFRAAALVALAALAEGPSTITGIGHIRNHETDRLAGSAAGCELFPQSGDRGDDFEGAGGGKSLEGAVQHRRAERNGRGTLKQAAAGKMKAAFGHVIPLLLRPWIDSSSSRGKIRGDSALSGNLVSVCYDKPGL